jgi:hypothetical protein
MSDSNDWQDDDRDDVQAMGMALISLGQAMTPAVQRGEYGVGDFHLPNGTVAGECFRAISVGCDDLYAHFGADRTGGLLGYSGERPVPCEWLKPGFPPPAGYPSVAKEGLYAPDGTVWEHGLYWRVGVVAVGDPHVPLDRPVFGTLIFKGKAYKDIGLPFYHQKLSTVSAVIDGKTVRSQVVALWEVRSEIAHGRNNYSWMVPKPTLAGVVGQPNGPSIEMVRFFKSLREIFKQGGAWDAVEPPPLLAAPPSRPALATPAKSPPIEQGRPRGKTSVSSGKRTNWEPTPPTPPIPPESPEPPKGESDYGVTRPFDDDVNF